VAWPIGHSNPAGSTVTPFSMACFHATLSMCPSE